MKCRHCGAPLALRCLDLGAAPPSNRYLTGQELDRPETWFPLRLLVCKECWLVQTEDFIRADELFRSDYAYFSSMSRTWLAHAERFAHEAIGQFGLDHKSTVCEVAANDGYLLQFFRQAGVPCFGVEPTAAAAQVARNVGLEIVESFFGVALANDLAQVERRCDLIVANNVLAHVPDINDFVSGFRVLLKETGVASFEFPHLLNMVRWGQFDTAYHEHFSYLSLVSVDRIFRANGLQIIDVVELDTHGGSLRILAQRADGGARAVRPSVRRILGEEVAAGILHARFYEDFQARSNAIKNDLLKFLIASKERNLKVVGYGAAAKGNTLLNFSGIRPDLLSYIVDRAPSKQGRYMPGSRIPILSEERIGIDRPDHILVLPWNLRSEIVEQLSYARSWGARFVTAIPKLTIE